MRDVMGYLHCGCDACERLVCLENARFARRSRNSRSYCLQDEANKRPNMSQLFDRPQTLTRNPFPELSSPVHDPMMSVLSPTLHYHIRMTTSAHSTPGSSPPQAPSYLDDQESRITSSYHSLFGSDPDINCGYSNPHSNIVSAITSGFCVPRSQSDYRYCHIEEETPTTNSIVIYTDDDNYRTLLVDNGTRASDVIQTSIENSNVTPDVNWVIVEVNTKLKQERFIEDDECIHTIQRQWSNPSHFRLYLRKDFRKYQMFRNPSNFMPVDLVDTTQLHDSDMSDLLPAQDRYNEILLQHLFSLFRLPDIHCSCLLKDHKRSWKRLYIILKPTGLFFSTKGSPKDNKHLTLLSNLSDVNIYMVQTPAKSVGSPLPHCLCLKMPKTTDLKEMIFLSTDDEKIFTCLLTTLRLVKYGSQIQESYKSTVNQLEKTILQSSLPESDDDKSWRVAMDFSGSSGRVVDSPMETLAAACEETKQWRKKLTLRRLCKGEMSVERPSFLNSHHPVAGLSAGLHMAQPWFHSGISRQDAINLLTKHGLVDGVFLVRESHSIPGVFVLSLVHNFKVKHCQIQKMEVDGICCYSLDGGHTKFTDLTQLVEFYQLNAAGLPCSLTHYVTPLL